jgi:tripartite-type tricarboxylate transporter receptor subunit TctC
VSSITQGRRPPSWIESLDAITRSSNCGRARARSWAGIILGVIALSAPQLRAETVDEFYKGKRINLIVGYGPGGGYDVFARLLARHLGKYIPGGPQILVQNMPGAGSLIAANHLYSVAPRDGTTFGLVARDMPLLGLIGNNSNVQFDPRKFSWLGSSSNFSDDAYVMIVRTDAPVKSIEDARRPGSPALLLGGTADGATGGDVPRILQDALGLRIKLVLGYRDTAAIFLAMERGEVSGRMTDLSAIQSIRPDWLKRDSGFHLLVQFGRLTRHPDYPDVPTARELALTPSGRALIEFAETPLLTMARPFAAPPGVPQERIRALQTAFLAAHRDRQYLDEAAKLGVYISPVSGEDMVRSIEKMARASPELFEQVRKVLAAKKGGG